MTVTVVFDSGKMEHYPNTISLRHLTAHSVEIIQRDTPQGGRIVATGIKDVLTRLEK